MKHFYVLLLLLLYAFGYSQSDSLKTFYKEMIMDNNYLYALGSKGELSVWDLNTLKKRHSAQDTMYYSIAKDRDNNIHIGTKNGRLAKLNKERFSLDWYSQLEKKVLIHNIFFNSQNKMFLIIPNCVYDPVDDKYWDKFKIVPRSGMVAITIKRFLFFSYSRPAKYNFMPPKYSFIDSQDRIWMGNTFGEFGTILNVFDSKKQKEIDPDIFESYGELSLQSVVEDDKKNVYITSGLQHMINFGSIYKIVNGKAVTIFNSLDYKPDTLEGNLYIGPGAFNVKEQKLYFATQMGIYKATVPEKGKITVLEKVFSPELIYNRENLAIGMQMAIKKMEFTADNRLVLLTSNNGILVYDGKEIIRLE